MATEFKLSYTGSEINEKLGKVDGAVRFDTAQNLTDEQKAQARTNIGAAAEGTDGGGGTSVQSDWNQTDETAADFIKNKPFGDDETVLFEGDIAFDGGEGAITVSTVPAVGSYVTVNWDGAEYVCQASDFNGASFIGNGAVVGLDPTDEPFAFMFVTTEMVFALCSEEKTAATVKLSGSAVNKLDSKYVSASTVYYINPDETDVYLYADIGLTTRITAGELKTAIKNTSVTLSEGDIYFYAVNDVIVAGQYGSVTWNRTHKDDGQIHVKERIFFTAEYTPEA